MGYFIRKDDTFCEFYNEKGKRVGGLYRNITPFSDGYASVQFYDYSWGILDEKGKAVGGRYDLTMPFEDKMAHVVLNGKSFYVDTDFKKITKNEVLRRKIIGQLDKLNKFEENKNM